MNEKDLDKLADAGADLAKAGCGLMIILFVLLPVLFLTVLFVLAGLGVLD